MALRSTGDDYEHTAIAPPNQQTRPTGARAAFRGEHVERQPDVAVGRRADGAEPFRTIAVSGQVIDIIADAIAEELPERIKLKPSEYLNAAQCIMEYLRDRGFHITRT